MIRLASYADMPHLVKIGKTFWAQTAYNDIPYCPDSIMYFCSQIIESNLLFVSDDDGINGVIGLVMAPIYANRDYMQISEVFFYVDEKVRRSSVGSDLLNAAIDAAKKNKCHTLSMMSLEAVNPEAVDKFYKNAGLKLTERTYVLRL